MSAVSTKELAALDVFADISLADLAALAANLQPVHAVAGEVLMRQGERAMSFMIIASGRVEISHVGPDGRVAVTELSPGLIVGEIALLRRAPRTATVIAKDDVRGYVGYDGAFACMLAMPAIADRMVRTARQRLAAYITPIPVGADDGAELLLRPVLPGDAERFVNSGAFSRENLHRRFLSSYALTEARLAYLFEVDYVDHFVLVVTRGVDGPVVAVGRFVRDKDDPASAEVAITVADAYQRRGIGTLVLAALAIAARIDGIERFHGWMSSYNEGARALANKLHARSEHEDGVITTTMEIPALDDLPIDNEARRQIQHAARQIIHAFD